MIRRTEKGAKSNGKTSPGGAVHPPRSVFTFGESSPHPISSTPV